MSQALTSWSAMSPCHFYCEIATRRSGAVSSHEFAVLASREPMLEPPIHVKTRDRLSVPYG